MSDAQRWAALDLIAAILAASVQRDPRHRVSMLANDWAAIVQAADRAVTALDRSGHEAGA